MRTKIRIRKRIHPTDGVLRWMVDIPDAYGRSVIWMTHGAEWRHAIDEANYIINGWGKFA